MRVGDRVRLIGLDGPQGTVGEVVKVLKGMGHRHGPGALDGPDPPDAAARGGVP